MKYSFPKKILSLFLTFTFLTPNLLVSPSVLAQTKRNTSSKTEPKKRVVDQPSAPNLGLRGPPGVIADPRRQGTGGRPYVNPFCAEMERVVRSHYPREKMAISEVTTRNCSDVNMDMPGILRAMCDNYSKAAIRPTPAEQRAILYPDPIHPDPANKGIWFNNVVDFHHLSLCLSEDQYKQADWAFRNGMKTLVDVSPNADARRASQALANAQLLFVDIAPRLIPVIQQGKTKALKGVVLLSIFPAPWERAFGIVLSQRDAGVPTAGPLFPQIHGTNPV